MSDRLFGTSPAREPWNATSPWARWWESESARAWRLIWEQVITDDVHPPRARRGSA